MSDKQLRVRQIFHKCREAESSAAIAAILDGECRNEPDLRKLVLSLLEARPCDDGFLEAPPGMSCVLTEQRAVAQTLEISGGSCHAQRMTGGYKILQQIGEGGFGIVYMAQQTEPVRRKVALKVIKPGMDSKEVVARFEAERQTLAMMDHPNVAKVLDGGTTESGRPFFVMELVHGTPITEFCNENRFV